MRNGLEIWPKFLGILAQGRVQKGKETQKGKTALSKSKEVICLSTGFIHCRLRML
jgi:hypothetical protein